MPMSVRNQHFATLQQNLHRAQVYTNPDLHRTHTTQTYTKPSFTFQKAQIFTKAKSTQPKFS